MKRSLRLSIGVCSLLASLNATTALAEQVNGATRARALFQEGRELAAAGRYLDKVAKHETPRDPSTVGLPTPAPMVVPLVVDGKLRSRAKAWAELQAEYQILADIDARIRESPSGTRGRLSLHGRP